MSYEMDMLRSEERGFEEGREEGRKDTILAMLKHGMSSDTIAQIVGWTNEKVRELGKINGIL